MKLFDWILVITALCGIYVCYWFIRGFFRDAVDYSDECVENIDALSKNVDDILYRKELKKKLDKVEAEYKKRHPEPDQDFMNGLKPTP
jgi:hypothetical protein